MLADADLRAIRDAGLIDDTKLAEITDFLEQRHPAATRQTAPRFDLTHVLWYAGALIIIGLATRPAAFIASGMSAVGYWVAHGSQGPYPIANGGETIALYCFIFLFIATRGAGIWSVDAARAK